MYAREWVEELDKAEKILMSAAAAPEAGEPVRPAQSQEATCIFQDLQALRASNGALVELVSDFPNVKFLYDPESKSLYAFAEGAAGTIPAGKQVFCHSAGDWVRPPQSTRLLAKADTEELCLHVFILENDETAVCVEVPGATGAEDTDPAPVHVVMQESTMAGMVDLKWWHHTVKLGGPSSFVEV